MILKVTERCAWENESWSYFIDLSGQSAEAINFLMIFIRCANAHFEKVKEATDKQPPALKPHFLFNRHPRNPFAASRYTFEFYDAADEKEFELKRGRTRIHISERSGYHNFNNFRIDRKISIARMKSAMISMRDKKENKLYKSFDRIFLTSKLKPCNQSA
jgi:hypothetical protein